MFPHVKVIYEGDYIILISVPGTLRDSQPAFTCRAYFRETRHACGMNRKWLFLVNLGQFEDETPLNIL